MMTPVSTWIATIHLAASVALAGAAGMAVRPAAAAELPAAGPIAGFDGAQLRAFASAAEAVSALRGEYTPRVQIANSVESRERAEALFAEMRARMHAAIEAAGLTPALYDAIAAAAERDRDLRRRIEAARHGGGQDVGTGAAAGDEDRMRRELAAAHGMLIDLRSQLEAERARTAEARIRLAEERAAQAMERAAGDAARVRAEAERDGLRREMERLARDLAATGAAMGALAASREPGEAEPVAAGTGAAPAPVFGFRPFMAVAATDFESARRVSVPSETGPSRDALLARLEDERVRRAAADARRAADRAATQREIKRLSRDVAAGGEALSSIAASLDARLAGPPAPEGDAPDAPATVGAIPVPSGDEPGPADPPAASLPPEVPAPAGPAIPVASVADRAAPEERPDVLRGIAAYVDGDYRRAYEIWSPLAEAGDGRAQFHLAALHFEGRGTERDIVEAHRWLTRALQRGYAPARDLLDRVTRAMTPDQRVAAIVPAAQ